MNNHLLQIAAHEHNLSQAWHNAGSFRRLGHALAEWHELAAQHAIQCWEDVSNRAGSPESQRPFHAASDGTIRPLDVPALGEVDALFNADARTAA